MNRIAKHFTNFEALITKTISSLNSYSFFLILYLDKLFDNMIHPENIQGSIQQCVLSKAENIRMKH